MGCGAQGLGFTLGQSYKVLLGSSWDLLGGSWDLVQGIEKAGLISVYLELE